MSQDHRPSYLPERKRVEELGGYIDDGYLNGYLSVTRALGDWDMKFPLGSASPLIAEPDVRQIVLSDDDEFLIIGCDGIWDVMSSQFAVSLVRCALRRHNNPEECARELVNEATRLNSSDNLTAIVLCFSTPARVESCPPQRQRFRSCNLSEESRIESLEEDRKAACSFVGVEECKISDFVSFFMMSGGVEELHCRMFNCNEVLFTAEMVSLP
ncbi:putative protein phosphatase 2C 13 [Hibiscus syriacus]|uniref:PPM-type phosphatase domain-containing protein n=1 Tax=Hibiscus syriacus TaxID=106335 RepID=A0A6A3D380_HIBSY|nr:putative protein phosphatase 2C 13 [Hibiscus syriacus]